MFCTPSVSQLVSLLFAPGGTEAIVGGRVLARIVARLHQAHVDLLLECAAARFGGRVHATARALLDHAMQAPPGHAVVGAVLCGENNPTGMATSTASDHQHDIREHEHHDWVFFKLQIAQVHLDWLRVLEADRAQCGIDAIIREIMNNYLRMPEDALDHLLLKLSVAGDLTPSHSTTKHASPANSRVLRHPATSNPQSGRTPIGFGV